MSPVEVFYPKGRKRGLIARIQVDFGRMDCAEFESHEKLESQFEAQVRRHLETGTC